MGFSAVAQLSGKWLRANWVAVVPLVSLSTVLLVVSDGLALSAVWFLVSLALGLWFLVVAWRLRDSDVPVAVLIGVAVALRLVAVGLPLSLSDDVFRYVWDGRVAAAGFNPYELTPDDPSLTELRDDLWERVAHRDVETVYPPVSIYFFGLASATGAPVVVWKSFLVGVDLSSCWLMLMLARRYNVASGRTVGYLWNPLVVVEICGMGHVDGLAILPLLLAAWWLMRSDDQPAPHEGWRSGLAALALAVAALVKIVPVLAMAPWAGLSRRKWVFLIVSAVALLAVSLPVVLSSGGLPPGLWTYGVSWEYNGPLFEPLWRLFDAAHVDAAAKVVLGWMGRLVGDGLVAGWYALLYPQLIAKAILGVGLLFALGYSAFRSNDVVSGALLAFSSFIAASATVYPWYLLMVVPWAALLGRRSWLVLTVSIQFAYLPRLLDLDYFPWVYLAVWVPFVFSFLVERALQTDTVVSG